MLNGIDVSGNQPANICSLVDYDFAIVKATGNPNLKNYKWNFHNTRMKQQADDVLHRGKLLGLYHFAYGVDPIIEADFFIDKVAPYVGQAILVLDYEAPLSNSDRTSWCSIFIRRVKEKTGVTCLLYASSSVIKSQNLSDFAAKEGSRLWSANYWRGSTVINGYNINGLKMNIADSTIWQYTEKGLLSGYNGYLDLDAFYGDANLWRQLANANSIQLPVPSPDLSGVVEQVFANKYGSGKKRRVNLANAGYNPDDVQKLVNEKIASIRGKSENEVANMTINGECYNGAARKGLLESAGFNYRRVQNIVNKLV